MASLKGSESWQISFIQHNFTERSIMTIISKKLWKSPEIGDENGNGFGFVKTDWILANLILQTQFHRDGDYNQDFKEIMKIARNQRWERQWLRIREKRANLGEPHSSSTISPRGASWPLFQTNYENRQKSAMRTAMTSDSWKDSESWRISFMQHNFTEKSIKFKEN